MRDGARKAELKRAYREAGPAAGVFRIRCAATGSEAVGSALNAQGALNRYRFELTQRMHKTWPALQVDWDRLGAEAFTFEILDVLPPSSEPGVDPLEELKVLESLWRARLQG